ncbi:MAG: hypothetical protein LUG23_08585 [Oscillospiraceae bacterium]|nr:hypothetical protein [Oscillospiraceae bacterium]
MKEKIKSNALYIVIALVLGFLIVVPILTVFARAIVTDEGTIDFADAIATICDSDNLETIGNSLLLGVLVVITSTIIATPLAFILTRTSFARKKWLDIVLMIPFMTPPYISSSG